MKLTRLTLNMLKNFAAINQGIVVKPGKRLRTISILGNIFADVAIDNEFETEFAIYDLNEFISALTVLDDPDLTFMKDHILLSDSTSNLKYFYSSPSVIVSPPDKEISMSNEVGSFDVSGEALTKLQKAAAMMKLKEFKFGATSITALNINSVGNQFSLAINNDHIDQPAQYIKTDDLRLVEGNYRVDVFENAIRFKNKDIESLVYYVSVESVD